MAAAAVAGVGGYRGDPVGDQPDAQQAARPVRVGERLQRRARRARGRLQGRADGGTRPAGASRRPPARQPTVSRRPYSQCSS